MIWALILAALGGLAIWKRQEVKKGAEKATQMGTETYQAARAKMSKAEESIDLTAEEAAEAADAAADEASDAAGSSDATSESEAKADN